MILTAAIGWMAQTVRGEVMNNLWQTVEDARHVGLDKKDLLMEVRRPGVYDNSDVKAHFYRMTLFLNLKGLTTLRPCALLVRSCHLRRTSANFLRD